MTAKEQLFLAHTVKGNAAQCELKSVADAAHEVESFIVEQGVRAGRDQLYSLFHAWDALCIAITSLVGTDASRVEITPPISSRSLSQSGKASPHLRSCDGSSRSSTSPWRSASPG